MKISLALLALFAGICSCNQKISTINYACDSVLVLHPDSLHHLGGSFTLYNVDNTVFASIKEIEGEEPAADTLNDQILAYYPFYYIIHFEAASIDVATYVVKMKDQYKIIKKGPYMRLLSWPEYVSENLCRADKDNPLRTMPYDTAAKVVVSDRELGFKILEMKGDWLKVRCFYECEGCDGENGLKRVSGWIRWRKNGKILKNQVFGC